MKRIIFVRHGQAETGMAGLSDFERSLTHKGKDISRHMAMKLKEKVRDPGLLITSPAFRAYETAMIFAGVNGIPYDKVVLRNNLYLSIDAGSLINILMMVSEDTDTVTFFGHNPTFTDLTNYFCTELLESLSKSAIASLTFETKTWSGIKAGSGKCELYLKPKKTL
jgi:phosphohistidine phosphatase